MLLRSIRAELMKCRRSPVWLAFVVLPLFPAILGTVNYLGNLEVLKSQWYSLWTQHVLFASLFFLPAQLGVFCAWQWRLEHTDHNWNQAMTAPVPARDLYLAKLVLAAGVSFLAQAAIGALFVLSGKLAGLADPVPPELPGWLFFGALGGAAVCALQLYLSLVVRAFAIPVAMALAGGIAGLMLTSQRLGYAFPYSLLCLGMRANNPTMELELGPFSGVVPECVQMYLDVLGKGTSAEGARIEARRLPLKVECRDCGAAAEIDRRHIQCPACGSLRLKRLSGRECTVESLEVD